MILTYKGIWNADTNTPELSDGVGATGDAYTINMNSTVLINTVDLGTGARSVASYTYLIYDGSVWNCSIS